LYSAKWLSHPEKLRAPPQFLPAGASDRPCCLLPQLSPHSSTAFLITLRGKKGNAGNLGGSSRQPPVRPLGILLARAHAALPVIGFTEFAAQCVKPFMRFVFQVPIPARVILGSLFAALTFLFSLSIGDPRSLSKAHHTLAHVRGHPACFSYLPPPAFSFGLHLPARTTHAPFF